MIFNNNDLPVRLLTLMLAALMCTSMSGCRGTAGAESSQSPPAMVSSTEVIYNTIEPPADGWTDELVNQVTYFCGKPVSLPCKFDDLNLYDCLKWDEPYLQKDEPTYIYNGKEYNEIYNISFCYNDMDIGGCGYILDNDQKIVIYIYSHRIPEKQIEKHNLDSSVVDKLNNLFVINNIYNGLTEEDIISSFGDKYTKQGNFYQLVYTANETEIIFTIPDNDPNKKVSQITIAYNYKLFSNSK